jgi:hypothetical protein
VRAERAGARWTPSCLPALRVLLSAASARLARARRGHAEHARRAPGAPDACCRDASAPSTVVDVTFVSTRVLKRPPAARWRCRELCCSERHCHLRRAVAVVVAVGLACQ